MKTVSFSLSNENISKYITLITETGTHYRAQKRMLTESRLALEEIMLNYQEHFGTEQEVTLKLKKRSGRFVCVLSLNGERFNPIVKNESEQNGFILNSLNLSPRYSYSLGVNQISVSCETNQGGKELRTIFLSVIVGVALGVLGNLLPDAVRFPVSSLVDAISNAIFGLMKMAAIPVVFLCVIYGVLGSGTIRNFRKNGVGILRKYFFSIFCMIVFISGISMLAFNIRIATGKLDASMIDTVIDNVFGMIPNNIFSSFVEGDSVKVIILGMLFGCAMLTLGDKAATVNRGFYQLKELCSTVMSWVGKLIPLLIVVVIISNIWSGNFGVEMLSVWKIVAVYLSCILFVFAFTVLRTVYTCKIGFSELMSAILVPGVKALISSSTIFCYTDMVEGLKTKLGVSEKTVDFSVPLGYAFYQPSSLLYAVFVLYYSAASGISVDHIWIFAFLLICFVTGIAVPPVSGGLVSLLAVLFVSFGIKDTVTAAALPLMMLLDYPNTSFRVMMMMMEIKIIDAKQKKKGIAE